jgi:RNA polymerase sigma factor (sigma-70 family)
MGNQTDRHLAEARFRTVFSHLGAVTAYARRRGSTDADAIAAETMTVAWRRLADVPKDDPRPWLYATARNLMLADTRRSTGTSTIALRDEQQLAPAPELQELDPGLSEALHSLAPIDRDALLLVAWEDLTPTQAARALGINPTAFRVRLLRARRRLRGRLSDHAAQDAAEPHSVGSIVEGA